MASHPQLSTDRFALKMGSFYAAYFLFGGIQLPFFPLWLEAKGLDPSTIGIVVAVPTMMRIFITPIAAHQADRHRALKAALVIASTGGALAMVVVGFAEGLIPILIAYVVAACFFSPLLAVSDAYALNGLRARGRAYGPVRLWGSVAFIAGNIGVGFLLDAIAPSQIVWLIVAALSLSAVAALMLAPMETGQAAPAGPAPSPKVLLRDPAFLAVVAAAALIQGSHALYYGFSTMEWRNAGFDGLTIGLLWGIGVLAEIVLFAVSARLPAMLGPTVLLAIGGAGAILRWSAMALDPPVTLLPVLQMLHALSFGAAHLGAMGFLARAVPRELAATAQGMLATVAGIVMASATALSGLAYAASGALAYLMMAGMGLAGLASALLAYALAPGLRRS